MPSASPPVPRLLPAGPPLPALGPQVPRRRYPPGVSAVGRGLFRLLGWRYAGAFPDAPSQVLIGAPHTSNWDGLVCLSAAVGLGLGVDVLAKRQLFRGPLGWLLRRLGGVPIDRDLPGGIVGNAVARLTSDGGTVLAIAPEGTRGPVAGWKTGFHRIALEAGVPITVLGIDWGRKEITVRGALVPSADLAADLAAIGDLLAGVEGKHPVRAWIPGREARA